MGTSSWQVGGIAAHFLTILRTKIFLDDDEIPASILTRGFWPSLWKSWSRICKLLRSPGINFKESLLGLLKSLEIRAQLGCHLPNSQWAEIIKLFPPIESLVSDIPAGDRNVATFFTETYCYLDGRAGWWPPRTFLWLSFLGPPQLIQTCANCIGLLNWSLKWQSESIEWFIEY